MMKNRTRPVRIEFRVTEQERQLIQKKLAAAVSNVAANINHICRRINHAGRFYADDVAELKARQAEIWQLLKQSQKDEIPP